MALRPSAIILPGLAFACFLPAVSAGAHTVWLLPEAGRANSWRVMFGGHAGKTDAYPAAKLKSVTARGADGTMLGVRRFPTARGVRLAIVGRPSLILAQFDNGIHTKRSNGPSVEMPMDRVPGAISATRAIKYHKTIANWAPLVLQPAGQPFEVVPIQAARPSAGTPMLVKVLIHGKPAPGISISHDEAGNGTITDARGIAQFVPVRGYNKLWSGRRVPVHGNPAFTEESVEYSLGFFAR